MCDTEEWQQLTKDELKLLKKCSWNAVWRVVSW